MLPEGILYQQFFNNMTMGRDFAVNIDVPGVGGVFAILMQHGTKESLLIVNTNNTKAINLAIPLSVFPVGGTGSVRSWDPRSSFPTTQTGVLLPSLYTVWSQGILLINNY